MIYHERTNLPAHVEAYHEGGFFVVEWTDDNQNLEAIINEKFGSEVWIERYESKEKFLKAFIGKENGVFKMWLSSNTTKAHNILFFSLPKDAIKNIKASGELIKETMNFVIASTSLYEKMILDRDIAITWMSENLPNWT